MDIGRQNELLDGLRLNPADPNSPLHRRLGIVTAASESTKTCSVQIAGSSTTVTGVQYMSTYCPTVNDPVWLLEIAGDFLIIAGQVSAGSARVWAPGDIKFSGRSAPETGWLTCDGAAVSRTTYAALFTAISTTYGTGDGSTTFNLPNSSGRGLIGAGAGSGLTSRSRGQSGGEETHVITTGESSYNSWHNQGGWSYGVIGADYFMITGSVGSGAGNAHNTMQPWWCAYAFIKA